MFPFQKKCATAKVTKSHFQTFLKKNFFFLAKSRKSYFGRHTFFFEYNGEEYIIRTKHS